MYGVVTRYVFKPKRALARSSSAPSIHSINQSLNQSIHSTHSYGTGDELVAIPQSINEQSSQLERSRSEFPASRMTVYSYSTNPSPHQSPNQSINQSHESMPLMGFLSPVKSDDKLPIILTLASSLGSLLFGFHIGYSSPFEQSIHESINQSIKQASNPSIGQTGNQTNLVGRPIRHYPSYTFDDPSTNQFLNQSLSHSINDPVNQSINEFVTKSQLDFMFSLISIGAIIGSLTSGPVAAKYGRRFAIMLSSVPYLTGALIMVMSTSINQSIESINQSINLAYWSLCIGRLLIGVGVGSSSVLVPLYIAEISPPSLRGSLGATNSFCMSLGLVFVNSLGLGGVYYPHFWQISLLLTFIPLGLMVLIMWSIGVETPRYLMSVDREEEAKLSLRKLRGDRWDVDGELRDLAGWDEFGLGSVSQSKAMLRRWKEEYLALFESENQSINQSSDDSSNDDDEYTLSKSTSIDDLHIKQELQMPPSPPTIDQSTNQSNNHSINQSINQVTTPRSADLNVGLKSALSSKRSSSANMSDEAINQSNNQSIMLPEQKKTVRVKLPGRDEAESINRSPSPPKHSLARARSVARRAFPIHAVTTSARPWWSTSEEDDENQSINQSIYFQRENLIPLLIGVSLQFIQQASGINAFMFHMKDLLQGGEQTQSNDQSINQSATISALYGAIAVNGLQLCMGGVALLLMDRAGRRTWLLASCVGLSFGAFLLSYCYMMSLSNSLKIVSMMIYIASFAVGMGPMPWLICSEIFPSAIRSTAISLATTVNWASAFLVTASFPLIDHLIGTAGVYSLYGSLIAVSAIYIAFILPETRGKSLDEIEAMFTKQSQSHSHSHDSYA